MLAEEREGKNGRLSSFHSLFSNEKKMRLSNHFSFAYKHRGPNVHLSNCPLVQMSICSFVCLSICPLVHLSACPLVHLSICPLVHLSLSPFVGPFVQSSWPFSLQCQNLLSREKLRVSTAFEEFQPDKLLRSCCCLIGKNKSSAMRVVLVANKCYFFLEACFYNRNYFGNEVELGHFQV